MLVASSVSLGFMLHWREWAVFFPVYSPFKCYLSFSLCFVLWWMSPVERSSVSLSSTNVPQSLSPCSPLTPPNGLSPGPPLGLWCCCSVEVEWVWGYEVGGCDVAALGWVLLHPHCLCWMTMVVGVGVAGAGVLMMVVFLLRLTLYYCLISGSGSSGTPGRSSHECSCVQAASQGWGLVEEGWCLRPVDHLGSVVAQGPDLKVLRLLLHLQLHLSGGQLRCRACRCWGASPGQGAGAEGPPGLCVWGVAGLLNCWGADGGAYESSSYRRRRFGTRWSSPDRQTPREEREGGRKEGRTGKREGGKGRRGATDTK